MFALKIQSVGILTVFCGSTRLGLHIQGEVYLPAWNNVVKRKWIMVFCCEKSKKNLRFLIVETGKRKSGQKNSLRPWKLDSLLSAIVFCHVVGPHVKIAAPIYCEGLNKRILKSWNQYHAVPARRPLSQQD